MDYRREIDGLRALAVLPVILFHAGFEIFSGGFVGVDVFFVISGYLITTIILAELEQGKFSIVNFYERRARRILPALFLVMLVCIPFAWCWLLPSDLKDFSQSLVATSVFASNILFWRERGYFDTAAELKPLLHTWSLAVEEQYYVLFPLFLILFWKLGKRWILVTLGLVLLASLALAQWAAYAKPTAAFYLLPTRGWELLIGAFAAFYLSQPNRKDFGNGLSEFGGWLGVVLIFYAVFTYSKATPFPGFHALVPTLGTVLIILFATQQTIVGRFIGNKAFVGIGLISYSAYLWHQPLFAFARSYTFNLLSIQLTTTLIFLSFILAVMSFKYVETPFRVKSKISQIRFFPLSLIGMMFFIFVGAVGHLKDGFPGPHTSINQAIDDWQHPGTLIKTNIVGFYKLKYDKPVEVLFFGDSLAEQFAPLASEVEKLGVNIGFLTEGGCPPIPNLLDDLHPRCFSLFDNLYEVLSREKKIKKIVVSGCLNCYFIDQSRQVRAPGDDYNYYYLDGNERLFFREGKGQAKSLISLNKFLESLSLKYQVVFIGFNPSSDNFDPVVLMSNKIRGDSIFFRHRYPSFTEAEFQVSNEEISLDNQLREATPSIAKYISLIDIVCPNKTCRATNSYGAPIYKDKNHMRPTFVKEVIGPQLTEHLKFD